MSQPPNPTLTVQLNLSQINTVLQHLHAGAYATVAPIIDSITAQSEDQLAEIRAKQVADARQASLPDVEPTPATN